MSQGKLYNDAPTPMLRQYLRIKAEHPDSILLFRLGDFYEMFYKDAEIASNILDITLTSRNKNDPDPIPLCGVPYHSVEPYVAKLLESGKKVAICDQVEDPKLARGVVRREVTRVLTPGVVADGLGLDAAEDNFLAGISRHGHVLGLAIADVSTGFFQADQFSNADELLEELARIEPREVVLVEGSDGAPTLDEMRVRFPTVLFTAVPKEKIEGVRLDDISGGAEMVRDLPAAASAAAVALAYIDDTQKGRPAQIRGIRSGRAGATMRFDGATRLGLELTQTMRGGERKGSLLDALDRTSTAAGARMLKRWVLYPLTDPPEIRERLDAVETMMADATLPGSLRETLREIYDIERIVSRAASGGANARDMNALRTSVESAGRIKALLSGRPGLLGKLSDDIDPCAELAREIARKIVDDPPLTVREGGMIRDGVLAELDEIRDSVANGKRIIAGIEEKERAATGISSLKVRYNKVFGYYLEVTNTHRDKVPDHYIRKQTLTNAERFITPELKEHEEKVLGAGERMRALEHGIFVELRGTAVGETARLQRTASAIARIDALVSLARIAAEYDYAKPTVDDGDVIDIEEGRHPIVERANPAERFVPNDVRLDGEETRLVMITGPNMAGKSTVMRQTALIVLMAQMGSFVPAASARIGVVDRIFTRVGASDALAEGQSTFMVEMSEAALILREATERSLIIIDEIGRGTSTFDGLAIAWAVAEDIHDRVRARTMFATHYHELTELALTKHAIKNYNIAVREWNGEVIFLRRLVPGATSHSYGIQVARLAGLPEGVVVRAGEVLTNLEEGEFDEVGRPRIGTAHSAADDSKGSQYHLFTRRDESAVEKRLKEIDATAITPIEALNILHDLTKLEGD